MAAGLWNTSMNPTDYARKSFAGLITYLMPNGQAPIFGISSRLDSETAYQPEHGFWSKTMVFPSVTLTAAYTNVATSLTVAAITNILPGMVLHNPLTRENMLVTAATEGATTVTVQRGFGTVAAAASSGTTDQLIVIGTAFEEASVRPTALTILPTRTMNFTQIFRNTWMVSGTEGATAVIVGSNPDAQNKKDCAGFHATQIEQALVFGQKFSGTRNGQPIRTMDGIIQSVINAASGNYVTLGATTNYTQLEAALDPGFNQVTDPANPNSRLYFCGGLHRRGLHNIFRLNSQYMINGQQTDWGLQFDEFKIPRGRFAMIEHPLLNAYGAASFFAKMGVSLDLSSFSLAYMTGRNAVSRDFNVSGQSVPVDNGIDAVGGTITSELTSLVKNPTANIILTNFTAAQAG